MAQEPNPQPRKKYDAIEKEFLKEIGIHGNAKKEAFYEQQKRKKPDVGRNKNA